MVRPILFKLGDHAIVRHPHALRIDVIRLSKRSALHGRNSWSAAVYTLAWRKTKS
jgi:hypothetical protein